MNIVKIAVSLCLLSLLSINAACGQGEAPKPGPEHARLKKMEGTWDTSWSMGGKTSKGVATYKMDMNGLWLMSTFESDNPMGSGKFMGRGSDSYDPGSKKYVGVWIDSWSARPMMLEGTYDEAKKTMIMFGEATGPDGQKHKHRMESQMPDDNTMNFSMFMPDSKEPVFTIVYKRRK